MTCPKCNGKLIMLDNSHNDELNETYRRKKCSDCGHVIHTTEFEVDWDETFKKEWSKYYRANNRDKKGGVDRV